MIPVMSGLAAGLLNRPDLRGCRGALVVAAAPAIIAEIALEAKEWRPWANRAAC